MKPVTISIINQKGGVGKTTSSINVAAALTQLGKNVLLIDMDSQANSSDTLLEGTSIEDSPTTYEFILGSTDTPIGEKVRKNKYTLSEFVKSRKHIDGVIDIIPSDDRLSNLGLDLFHSSRRESALLRSFKTYSEELSKYDFILIDCPPSLDIETINAFVGTRWLLVPVDAVHYSIKGIDKLINTLSKCKNEFECETEILGIFITKYNERETIYKNLYEHLKTSAYGIFFESVIHKSTHIEQSPGFYKTIFEHAPLAKACNDYSQLTTEILNRLDGMKPKKAEQHEKTVA